MSDALTVREYARRVGITESAARSRIRRGTVAVVRRGARGRGAATLVDISDVRTSALVAAEVPELLSDALHALYVTIDHPSKRSVCAELVVACWDACTTAVVDALGSEMPDALPEKMRHLRSISNDSRTLIRNGRNGRPEREED